MLHNMWKIPRDKWIIACPNQMLDDVFAANLNYIESIVKFRAVYETCNSLRGFSIHRLFGRRELLVFVFHFHGCLWGHEKTNSYCVISEKILVFYVWWYHPSFILGLTKPKIISHVWVNRAYSLHVAKNIFYRRFPICNSFSSSPLST